MEILIKDFASNCSLNYFEVSLIEQGNEITSIKPLVFLEVIFRLNYLIKQYHLKNKDMIIYKMYDEQLTETSTIPITIDKFRGIST